MNWKPSSLSHVVSILALMISVLGINAITFYYIHTPSTTQLLFIELTNITYGIGMSYYAVNFAMSEQGVTIQSKPQTTTT
jgi:hypothetical protein